ncbi:MAG: hypothetical protein KJZ65_08360 [Phycisphaerales bacterium]|nr:hypothetical protein [Phycisphaerales bacterium]
MPARRRRLSWIRKRLLPAAARLLVVVALLVLAGWAVGQTLTDTHHITQYVWWIPTPIVLALAWPMVLASWVLERMSTRLGGYQLRPILSFALFGITVWFVFGVGHLHRLAIPVGKGSLRVAYWNLAVDDQADGAGEVVLDLMPDIAVVANPRWDESRGSLLHALHTLAPPPELTGPEAGAAVPVAMHFLFSSEIALATRGCITRWGSTTFSAGGVNDYEHRGVVLFAQIEGLTDQALTVWVVDLPSAPALWRMESMQQARSAIASWQGPAFVPSPEGKWVPQPDAGVFPNADLIVGDFNTPRGSASLEALVGSRTNAHAAAGRGFGYTWPRKGSILAIDHCFISGDLRAVAARAMDPGMGRHRLLLIDLKAP